ncbi:uncharacterized protein LOC128214953 [Mya arenaria]|nr:uncharacterized protein LOC128214953 [Mya arenaria]
MGLWQRIVSTKRFWSEDDDNNSKRTNKSVRQSFGMGDMAEIGSTYTSSVAMDGSACGRSFKNMKGRPPSVSQNDKNPYTEEKTITSQQEQRATGRSRKDIYDWLSGLQAGLDQKQTTTSMHARTNEQHTPSPQVRGIPQIGCSQPLTTAPVEVRKIQILTKHSYPSKSSTTVGQEESNDTLVSTPDSGKVFRSKPTPQTVATTFNTDMTSLKNVNTAYSSKAAGQDLKGRAIPVITGHSGIVSGKGGTIIRAPPKSSLHATSAGLKSGEIKHDTQTTQSLETRETNNQTTSRAMPAHQPQVVFPGPRSTDFPSQTSMFWSHQQREADQHWEQDGRRQHKQDDHKTTYSDLYSNFADGADGNSRSPQPNSATADQSGRTRYTEFDQRGDMGEWSRVHRLSYGNEQVHKQFAENNVKRDGNYEQEYQNLAKPTEQLLPSAGKWIGTQNTSATRPLSETWHYVFSQQQPSSDPQQVYQYDQSRPQDVKLDDEVWYINGVPFQHAKSLQIPFQYPDYVQSPSPSALPVSAQYSSGHITSQYQWSAGNCDNTQDTTTQSQVFAQPPPQLPIVFDPARGYHVYQMNLPANDYVTRNNANYCNTTRGKKSQANNSGYHLGVPIPNNQNNNSFLRDDGSVVTGDYRVEVVKQEPYTRSPCVSESPCESVDAHSSDRSSSHEPFASLESSSCISSFGDFVDSSSPSPFEDVESVDVKSHGEGTLFLDCLNQFEQPPTEPNLPIKSVCGDQCPELLSDVPFKAKKIRIIRNSSHAREQAIVAANKRKPTRNMRSGLITIL